MSFPLIKAIWLGEREKERRILKNFFLKTILFRMVSVNWLEARGCVRSIAIGFDLQHYESRR